MVVAKVSGESFGAFMQQRIFSPLAMTQTHQGYPLPPVTDLALGYHEDGVTIFRSWQPNLQWLAGPGGLTSTVGDMEKWDEAVRQPGIFSQASLTQMFTPSPISSPIGSYADGWFISQLNGHRYIWHDGFVGGFQTMNAMFPDDGIDIIILTNTGSGPDPYYIIPNIFPIALGM
jgi:CubicO group peptidase (beta-lactamase class C family)